MALRDQPYIPLYVQDYLTDEKLRECSPSSVGVYSFLMCVMHKSKEYGTFLLKQKDKQTDNQIKNFALKLRKHLPYEPDIIQDALTDLIDEKVLHLEGDKLLQKRMIADNELSNKRSLAGQVGGKKTQFALASVKAKSEANSENEYEYETEDEIIKEEEQVLMIQTFGRNPKIPELYYIRKHIDKFGFDKTKRIYKTAVMNNFYSLKTLDESLDESGNIIPKEKYKINGEPPEATQQELQEYATKNKLSPEQTTKLFKKYEYKDNKYRLKDTVCA